MRAQFAARGEIFEWPFAFRFDRMKAFDVNRKNGRGGRGGGSTMKRNVKVYRAYAINLRPERIRWESK